MSNKTSHLFCKHFLIKTPSSTEPGEYEVFVIANAGNPSGGLSILQEKTFNFIVNVTKPYTFFETGENQDKTTEKHVEEETLQKEVEKTPKKRITGLPILTLDTQIIFIALLVVILVVSWIIYKI